MLKFLLFVSLLVGCLKAKETETIRYTKPTDKVPVYVPQPDITFVDVPTLEGQVNFDLQLISGGDATRNKLRYLTACQDFNIGINVELIKQSVDKFLNSVSKAARVAMSTAIGSSKCTFRFNLDDFGLSIADWQLIEQRDLIQSNADPLRNSPTFQNIQFLTQSRRPILFVASIITTVMEADELTNENCDTYCTILDQPILNEEFDLKIGVNRQLEYDEERALLEGTDESKIAFGKTRLAEFFKPKAVRRFVITTFDSELANQFDIFETPFTLEAANAGGRIRSDKIFQGPFREVIYELDNGFYGVRVDADGVAASFAPIGVVGNTRGAAANRDGEIRLGDCTGCHPKIALPFTGKLYRHIIERPDFDADEKQLATTFMKPEKISARIAEMQNQYVERLESINNSSTIDSITEYSIYPFRAPFTPKRVCSYTFTPLEECLVRLAGTNKSSTLFGSTLNGGNISLAVFSKNYVQFEQEMLIYGGNEL